jgi:hypothetical protein
MTAAELASYGLRRCRGCGEAKHILSAESREQALAAGVDPDRCPACEQFAVIRDAHKTGGVLSLEQFEDALNMAGRIHGPALLLEARIFRVITDATITATVGPVWGDAEYPEGSLARANWLDLFTVAGFTIDGKPADRPVEAITLWRGSVHARRRRMSWTSDRAQAQRFADGVRGRPPGKLYQTLAPPHAILCINNGRQEAEYVINTRGLTIREA